ncbi:TonB-dependent receptor [Hirschia litorea]|uniref:TonB-dependent receptor domain-containing protein n=1 Tax=Hirschia litorea TaxID=1199156 RepID=A0ABW2IQ43_9PROT
MLFKRRFAFTAASIAIAAAFTPVAIAQTTSADISGRLLDANGKPLANTTVVITDQRTGSEAIAQTSANGTFYRTGLRVGGPYSVAAGTTKLEDVFLQPSSNTITLEPKLTQDTIVVSVGTSMLDLNNGVGSVYGSDDILSQPSANRSIIDTLSRDPLAQQTGQGALSIAGSNPRFNGLAIDGALIQDDFGLSSNTVPTNSGRSPISLDAVESVSVVASDYSVKASGFRGGLVNAITKSGTNKFKGSAFYTRRDEDYVGNTRFGQYVDVPAFNEEEYGLSLGGPILKDKLFFYANYEEFKTSSGRDFSIDDKNSGRTQELFDTLNQIVLDTYDIDMGGRPQTIQVPATTTRYLGKLDWYVSDAHRASATYQKIEDTGLSSISSSEFASAWYEAPQKIDVYTVQLNSDWTQNLSTELRLNYKENYRGQICGNPTYGEIDIRLSEADILGTVLEGLIDDGDDIVDTSEKYLTGSCDRYRHANSYDDERLQISAVGNYTLGEHLITFGTEYENFELFNLFVDRSNGEFIFNNVDDLINGNAKVLYSNSVTNDANDVATSWGLGKISLFAQDRWQLRPDLSVDYGLRYEYYTQDDEPQKSPAFLNQYGFDSNQNLDGIDILMPRIGFKYQPLENTTITGGFGLFAGGDPKVWISNAFQTIVAKVDGEFTGVDPKIVPQELLDQAAASDFSTLLPIDVISPDFEVPSDWKYSLKLDQAFSADLSRFGIPLQLGDDYNFSVQYLHAEVNHDFIWTNLAQTNLAETQPLGVAPDGRPIYADLDDLGLLNVTQLGTTNEGKSDVITVALNGQYDNGFAFNASYAYQDIQSVAPGTSTRGISSFRAIIDSDFNNPSLGTSNYETEHSFKLFASYNKQFFKGLNTKLSLFGTATSGAPISYTFEVNNGNALFGQVGDGEGATDNSLVYIPTQSNGQFNDPNVVFASSFDQDAFGEYIATRGLTSGVQSRGNGQGPWNTRFDFQWQQELPFADFGIKRFEGNKLKFVVDIENIANLLNDEWGTRYGTNTRIELVEADLVSASDVALNGVDGATSIRGDNQRTTCTTAGSCLYRYRDFDADPTGYQSNTSSVYNIRVGLRYEF